MDNNDWWRPLIAINLLFSKIIELIKFGLTAHTESWEGDKLNNVTHENMDEYLPSLPFKLFAEQFYI